MIEMIKDILQDSYSTVGNPDERYNVITPKGCRGVYSIPDSKLEDNNFYLSPLADAISAPLIFRSIHYRNMFDKGSKTLSRMANKILSHGEKIILNESGDESSQVWYYQRRRLIRDLVVAGRQQHIILDDDDSFCKITTSSEGSKCKDYLLFNFGTYKKIAEREYILHKGYSGLDGFRHIEKPYRELLTTLCEFYGQKRQVMYRYHHHLFVWADSPSGLYEKSFVDYAIENYWRDSTHNSKQSSFILLLVNDIKTCSEKITNFSDKEKLALQRADFSDGWLLMNYTLGSLEKKTEQVRNNMVEKCLHNLGLDMDITRLRNVISECQSNTTTKSSLAILMKCGVHSWLPSRQIDGEQVMTN